MSEYYSGADEWLTFGFDGLTLAVPNSRHHQINITGTLPGMVTPLPAPHLTTSGGEPVYALDRSLQLTSLQATSGEKRALFVLLSDGQIGYGLLVDWADVTHLDRKGTRSHPIPRPMWRKGSPLSGIITGHPNPEEMEPVYLATTPDMIGHLERLTAP